MTDQLEHTRPGDAPARDDAWVPADTRIMDIVHRALRRDLGRARVALTDPVPPLDDQRRAIAEHLRWMMSFLHHHHESEDAGLYPMVRERSADAATLLDDMDADHRRVSPAIDVLADAAAAYGRDARADDDLLAAIDALEVVLLPHLEREEREAMPLVSTVVSNDEWERWDEEMNVGPLPKRELAISGLWMMDSASPDDVAVVAALVPPVPRWFIMNVVSRSYRRAAFRRWGLPEHSTLRVALRGSTAVSTTAAPRQVWAVLSDVTRVGEWSHECQGASWLDGATSLAVGARFRGRNRAGSMRWSRPCTVTSLVPGEEVTWVTDGGIYGDNAAWRFRLVPDGTGTRIEQSFRVVNLPAWFDRFIWRMLPSHHDRSAALAADLERLGTLAAAET